MTTNAFITTGFDEEQCGEVLTTCPKLTEVQQ